MRIRTVVALGAAAGVLLGCAGSRPGDGSVLVAGKGYRVAPPAGWTRLDSGADVAFHHPALGAGLMAHGTCEGRTAERSLPVLTRHLRFGLKDVQRPDETPVALDGQPGVRSRFTARLDATPVAVSAVTLLGPRCVYDLVLVAPPGRFDAAAPDFERFAASFRLTGQTP